MFPTSPASLPPPSISADPEPGPQVILPAGWAEGQCWITGCQVNIGVWFSASHIRPSLMPELFGLPPSPRSYAEWERYPEFLGVCTRHWRTLRNKHGKELAYTMRDGRVRATIRDYYF